MHARLTCVTALEREKAEIADATTKLMAIEDRKRALERQLEAIRADTEEWAIKLAEIQDSQLPVFRCVRM